MLDEGKGSGASGEGATVTMMSGARLDPKLGKALREVLARLMKEKWGGSKTNAAKGLSMTPRGVAQILEGQSNGSLETARRVAMAARMPLENIVGPELALTAKRIQELKKREREARKAAEKVSPPPDLPKPVRHVEVAATGARVGEKVPEVTRALSRSELEDLRKGIPHAANMAVLVAEYERLTEREAKLSSKMLEMMLRDPQKTARVLDVMLGL